MITITVKQLREKYDACSAGIEGFLAVYPSGQVELDWTRDEQLRTLKTPLRRWLGWAWQTGLLPMWSMRNVDLRNADLRSADLRGADLSGADLSGADLSGAYLSGVNLRGADLSGADLSGAYLRGVDLHSADLRSADLRSADLRSADLRGADLRDAELYDTDLIGAKFCNHTRELSESARLVMVKIED